MQHKYFGLMLTGALCAGLIAGSSTARAGTLGLVTGPNVVPDIGASNITGTYTYSSVTSTGALSMTGPAGAALSYNTIAGSFSEYMIMGGQFSLNATLDSAGHLLPGGTVVIAGSALRNMTTSVMTPIVSPALTGNLTAFASAGNGANGGGEFQFRFNVTGGSLAPDYGGVGGAGGIKITALSGTFFDSFATSFMTNSSNSAADTVSTAAPTPVALHAGFVLLTGMVGLRRRRAVAC